MGYAGVFSPTNSSPDIPLTAGKAIPLPIEKAPPHLKLIYIYIRKESYSVHDRHVQVFVLRPSWFKTARMVAELRRLTVVSWSSRDF